MTYQLRGFHPVGAAGGSIPAVQLQVDPGRFVETNQRVDCPRLPYTVMVFKTEAGGSWGLEETKNPYTVHKAQLMAYQICDRGKP